MSVLKRLLATGAVVIATALIIAATATAAADPNASCVGLGASSAAGNPGTTAAVVDYFRTNAAPDPLGALISDHAQVHAGAVDNCGFPTP